MDTLMDTENPKKEFEQIDEESPFDQNLFIQRRCCCCIPVGVGSTWWKNVGRSPDGIDRRWWSKGVTALMKFREWSEIVAGPRWKTFIRRFNRTRSGNGGGGIGGSSGGGGGRNHHNHHGKFQYDALSYSLNFDEGQHGHNSHLDDGDDDDDYGGVRDFTSRYASGALSGRTQS